ncbi:MAG: DUF5069 domain-containing protein [Actinobacteria bacterium]|nr:DUF5069 domain-containing protein [Actinomycetota bacterium]
MDLSKGVPRSPYESLGGIVFLPRTIDKARAELSGGLGEYVSRTGFSKELFEFLGIAADDFIEALSTRATDADVWAWVSARMQAKTREEIAAWNHKMMTRTPQTPESLARFKDFLEKIGQAHRTDLTRQFDRLDLDEGRDVPYGGRQ